MTPADPFTPDLLSRLPQPPRKVALVRPSRTAGFTHDPGYAGRLDAALPLPTTGHEAQRVLALPLFLGAPAQGEEPEYRLWPEDHLGAETLLAPLKRPLVGLHPGAWDSDRQWPPDRFAPLQNGPFRIIRRAASTAVEDIAITQVLAAAHEVVREQSLE